MRIVHVITRLIVGGAQENTLYTCFDLAARHGDRVTLVTGPSAGPEGDLLEWARDRQLDVVEVPKLLRPIAPIADWSAYRTLCRIFEEIRPDVVHTHSSKAGILGRRAAHRAGVPAVVHTIHGLAFDDWQPWWRNRLYITAERRAARYCDRLISVADAMTAQAVAAGVAAADKFVTIYSGMDVEPFQSCSEHRQRVRKELRCSDAEFVIGKVARLFACKGHDDVIDAAKDVLQRHPHVRFLFVGGGNWRERLEGRIAALGLAEKFIFTGLVPPARIPELLSACDLVVHASYREGLARALPQAMLANKTVVTYDVGGASEVVVPGETGFLVPAGDVKGLAQALDHAVADPGLCRRLAETGRERCLGRFRHETMSERIRDVYTQILERKRST